MRRTRGPRRHQCWFHLEGWTTCTGYSRKGRNSFFLTPNPNLMVISSASKIRHQHSIPSDKEGKKIDGVGRNFYSTGALGIKATSYMACMARYSYALWEQLSDVLDLLFPEQTTKCKFLWKEGMLLGKQLLTLTKHVLDLFAKTVTSAVSLRRHAWLHSMDLQPDTRSIIEDLLFEGEGLFSTTTDTVLQEMDKSLKASRTLGVSSSSTKGSRSRSWSRSWSKYPRQSTDQSWRPKQQHSPRQPYHTKSKFQQGQQSRPKQPRTPKQGV